MLSCLLLAQESRQHDLAAEERRWAAIGFAAIITNMLLLLYDMEYRLPHGGR